MDPEIAARRGFDRRDFDLGHKLRLVDGEHDLFGDGSVVLLPTYGHTPGHQSMRLQLASADIVLAAGLVELRPLAIVAAVASCCFSALASAAAVGTALDFGSTLSTPFMPAWTLQK